MYLITGGAGFIGSNLVHALVARGQRVRVLDNLATGRLDNLEPARGAIEFVQGDIRSLETCQKALRNVRFILHQAALPSVPRSFEDPISSTAVNIHGTLNLLIAARDQRVERFVYAASSSAYGDTPTLPKVETMTPDPRSPYAISKLTGEHFCRVFAHAYGLPTVCLRYFNVYGPRQDPTSTYAAVIPRFITHCLRGTAATIFGDGTQSRDFTFVEDCVAANLMACEAPISGGEVCNIGAGSRISIAELHAMIRRITRSDASPRFEPPRPGDVKHSLADITRAKTLLGYSPRHDLKSGLARTVEWFSSRVALAPQP
jgi:UDP-N-acetylglucosamine/UDP-N-acetyl-alpha-D-glucosaminouronate 4-epimerase